MSFHCKEFRHTCSHTLRLVTGSETAGDRARLQPAKNTRTCAWEGGGPGSVAATGGISGGGSGDAATRGPAVAPGGALTAIKRACPIASVVASGSRTVYTGGHSVSAVSRSTVAVTMPAAGLEEGSMTSEPDGRYGASWAGVASAVAVDVVTVAVPAVAFTIRPS